MNSIMMKYIKDNKGHLLVGILVFIIMIVFSVYIWWAIDTLVTEERAIEVRESQEASVRYTIYMNAESGKMPVYHTDDYYYDGGVMTFDTIDGVKVRTFFSSVSRIEERNHE